MIGFDLIEDEGKKFSRGRRLLNLGIAIALMLDNLRKK